MKKVDNSQLVLANKIYNLHNKNNFSSFTVLGDRDIGKSTYSLKATQGAFMKIGYDYDEAWRLSLECIKFSIPQVVEYLKDALTGDEKKLVLVWDDVRIFAAGSQYFLNLKLYNELIGLLDSIKVAINCLILTCPSVQGILGVLKSYDDFQIKIKPARGIGADYRIAKGYKWDTLPSGQRRIYSKFKDTFYCRVPDPWYSIYYKMRKQASMDKVLGVEKAMETD